MTREQSDKTVAFLKECTRDQVCQFIRKRLKFEDRISQSIRSGKFPNTDHYRFEMSGYDCNVVGSAAVDVRHILDKFADLGIYNYHDVLVLNFWKGAHTIWYKPINGQLYEETDGGMGTVDLIYRIFELTIFSNYMKRVDQ